MILIRGIPGSGKSTLAKKLVENNANHRTHLEADMFWYLETGEYKWDASRLKEAHAWCLSETENVLMRGHVPVVSNTFTTKKELRPYFELARTYGVVPTVMITQNEWGNIHGVPEETLNRMRARFEYDISDIWRIPIRESDFI